MSDGLTLATLVGGALGGAAGNLLSDGARRAAPVIWRGVADAVREAMQRALPQARQRFEANAAGFVAALAEETVPADDPDGAERRAEAITRQLEDPDVAVAVADALRAAGRSSEPDRHRALAKVVAARLDAPPGSGHAAAANLAVRVLETLDAQHLRALALLALTHYVGRPNAVSADYPHFPARPPETLRARTPEAPAPTIEAQLATAEVLNAWIRSLGTPAAEYARHLVERLRRGAERVGVPPELPESVTTHLLASACVIPHASHPRLYEALTQIIEPAPSPDASMADRAPEHAIKQWYFQSLFLGSRQDDTLGRLADLWEAALHTLALTPAGFLIGLAALDVLAGEHTSAEWRWSGASEHAVARSPYRPPPAFNERWADDPKFHRVMESTLKQMDRRGMLRGFKD